MSRSPAQDGPVPLDGHVHCYPRYSLRRLFDSAARNFAEARGALGLPPGPVTGYLLLAEGDEPSVFTGLEERVGEGRAGGWSLRPTGEEESLVAGREDGARLVVVAGRQIRTSDGLEVLALCSRAEFEAERALEATIRTVGEAGAVPVVPWGFGKWWGRRGRRLRSLLERAEPGTLLLGDNSGRLRGAPRPALFRRAEERGVPVLPGSDPLPFRGEEEKVGSFGAFVRIHPGLERPAAVLREHLLGLRRSPRPYGEGETPGRFLRHQVALQLRKRL